MPPYAVNPRQRPTKGRDGHRREEGITKTRKDESTKKEERDGQIVGVPDTVSHVARFPASAFPVFLAFFVFSSFRAFVILLDRWFGHVTTRTYVSGRKKGLTA